MACKRALHFVFKIGDRRKTLQFYRDVLGMQVLRHEEFKAGCDAYCNGPYDGAWSKSMVGYGPEDNHFVIELTYNYGIGSYKHGNDFGGITIHSNAIISNATKLDWPVKEKEGKKYVEAPDGYKFYIENKEPLNDPLKKVSLACSSLSKSVDYWHEKCGMKIYHQNNEQALLGFGDDQCKLELYEIGMKIEHETAFGRIAFACPEIELENIQKKMQDSSERIIMPLIALDTPGKATVRVVILADPDGHEICFVGDEAFKELSQVDTQADNLLNKAMDDDQSDKWFSRHGGKKAA